MKDPRRTPVEALGSLLHDWSRRADCLLVSILRIIDRKETVAELQTVLNNIVFGESLRWHNDRLWFSDWGAHEVVAVDLEGHRETVMSVPTFPFSLDWLSNGQLLVVSSELERQEKDGSLVSHGDLSSLADGWNELVVDGRGNAYVNQAGFDLMGGAEPTSGTIALVRSDGTSEQVADEVWFPNGMAITSDNSTLIVAESYRSRLTAFDIDQIGGLSNRRVWADLGSDVPDGICLDAEGSVWYADVPHKHCARVREGGEVLEKIRADRGCFSCALGGPDGRTLFIAATEWRGPEKMFQGDPTGQILATRVDTPHAGHP